MRCRHPGTESANYFSPVPAHRVCGIPHQQDSACRADPFSDSK